MYLVGPPFFVLKEGIWYMECFWAQILSLPKYQHIGEIKNIRPGRPLNSKLLGLKNVINQTATRTRYTYVPKPPPLTPVDER